MGWGGVRGTICTVHVVVFGPENFIKLSSLIFLTDKSCTSPRKFYFTRKEDNKQKSSKSRTSKTEKSSKSASVHVEPSQSASRLQSKCLLYGQTDSQRAETDTVTAIGGRDTALFLFRALGKILHCKSKVIVSNLNFLTMYNVV